jgi:hypothetical protein
MANSISSAISDQPDMQLQELVLAQPETKVAIYCKVATYSKETGWKEEIVLRK